MMSLLILVVPIITENTSRRFLATINIAKVSIIEVGISAMDIAELGIAELLRLKHSYSYTSKGTDY
jgi:hypothetical protein